MLADTGRSSQPPTADAVNSAANIRRVFNLQRATSLRLRTSTLAERLDKLERLRLAVLAHRDAVVEAGARDFRKPESEVELMELLAVIMEIADARKHLRKWMRPLRVRPTSVMLGTRAEVRYEPRGRCLIIAPWNYPLTLTLGPLVPALAAGNTVVIKTSELTPHFSAVMARIIRSAFSEDEVAIFEGEASVAEELLGLPFDHVFFTGSPAIGKRVMAAASRHLSSVTLELGGKSPTIVDATADLDLAAKTIVWGKFSNNGQTCIAPDHVYVQSSVRDRFVECLCREITAAYGEPEVQQSKASISRIVNTRHTRRIAALLEDARSRGAQLLYGGIVDEADRFVSPTLLANVPDDARIMDEEIFGPLLPIISFDGIDDVIARINAAPKPLALYVWSYDARAVERVIASTSSGGTCVNHVLAQFLHHNLPFGGVNNSGIGNYHGRYGFKAFSHERSVVTTQVLLARLFFQPHSRLMRRIVGWMLRTW